MNRPSPSRRSMLAGVLVAVVAFCSIAPTAFAQDMPFDSKIRLKNSFPAFHGKVKSTGSSCIANRKVRLFREKKGEDKVLGKTRTGTDGKWQILVEPKSGAFYAKVNQFADEATGLVCNAAKSKIVVID